VTASSPHFHFSPIQFLNFSTYGKRKEQKQKKKKKKKKKEKFELKESTEFACPILTSQFVS
jgi:hypothetical protein